eukprot:1195656-Prorocentrum_minimum.AAC.6
MAKKALDFNFTRGEGEFTRGEGEFTRGEGDFTRGEGEFTRGEGEFTRGDSSRCHPIGRSTYLRMASGGGAPVKGLGGNRGSPHLRRRHPSPTPPTLSNAVTSPTGCNITHTL